VVRYHSLAVRADDLPGSLVADAFTDDGEIMALHHRTQPIFGVQFHPESILTEHGHALLRNFLAQVPA
jgi:anthranilate synthase component II